MKDYVATWVLVSTIWPLGTGCLSPSPDFVLRILLCPAEWEC